MFLSCLAPFCLDDRRLFTQHVQNSLNSILKIFCEFFFRHSTCNSYSFVKSIRINQSAVRLDFNEWAVWFTFSVIFPVYNLVAWRTPQLLK